VNLEIAALRQILLFFFFYEMFAPL